MVHVLATVHAIAIIVSSIGLLLFWVFSNPRPESFTFSSAIDRVPGAQAWAFFTYGFSFIVFNALIWYRWLRDRDLLAALLGSSIGLAVGIAIAIPWSVSIATHILFGGGAALLAALYVAAAIRSSTALVIVLFTLAASVSIGPIFVPGATDLHWTLVGIAEVLLAFVWSAFVVWLNWRPEKAQGFVV